MAAHGSHADTKEMKLSLENSVVKLLMFLDFCCTTSQ